MVELVSAELVELVSAELVEPVPDTCRSSNLQVLWRP
jgi:hypothetical protein